MANLNWSTILHGRRMETAPGVVLYETLSEHVSDDGREWPAGTEYTPLRAGGVGDDRYQTVSVRGQEVTFRGPRGR